MHVLFILKLKAKNTQGENEKGGQQARMRRAEANSQCEKSIIRLSD